MIKLTEETLKDYVDNEHIFEMWNDFCYITGAEGEILPMSEHKNLLMLHPNLKLDCFFDIDDNYCVIENDKTISSVPNIEHAIQWIVDFDQLIEWLKDGNAGCYKCLGNFFEYYT